MPISNLPTFFNMVYTQKDGTFTSDGYMYSDQTYQVLKNLVLMFNFETSTIFTNYETLVPLGIISPAYIGLSPPNFTTAQINAIVAIIPSIVSVGTTWYNSTLDKLQFLGSSGVQTITSTY